VGGCSAIIILGLTKKIHSEKHLSGKEGNYGTKAVSKKSKPSVGSSGRKIFGPDAQFARHGLSSPKG
jgi:hypothetical protein